jgi:hypothetical protein
MSEEEKKPRTIPGRGEEHYKKEDQQPISTPLYPDLNV